MILNNKVAQKLEIIGFKESVNKSTSRIQVVILILAITGLLNGISYLISGISARGIGGVNYGRVIFPLLVGAIAVYFLKKEKKK